MGNASVYCRINAFMVMEGERTKAESVYQDLCCCLLVRRQSLTSEADKEEEVPVHVRLRLSVFC